MLPNKLFWIVWFIFIGYSVFFAPNNVQKSKPTGLLVKQLLFGPWHDIDAYVVSLFYLLGIWPLVYTCVLLVDGQNQPFKGGLASLLSMALGGFALLPYCALRRSLNAVNYKINSRVRIFESKVVSIILILATIAIVLYGVIFGEFQNYVHDFRNSRFIHIMTIDFFVVSCLFPFLIPSDLRRREMTSKAEYQTYVYLGFLPLIGPLIYLYQRKPLKELNN